MPPKRKDTNGPTRLRVNALIDSDLRKRLAAFAGAHRLTESTVIESALTTHLAGFYFGQRTDKSAGQIDPEEIRTILPLKTG